MEPRDYTIVRYRPEHRNQILMLQTHLWGPNLKTNDEYLEWKYFRNPYNTEPLIYVALCENEVAGMRGYYGTCWEVAGEDILYNWLYGCDSVVHPNHRRRGLLSKLIAASTEDLANSGYGYSISLSAHIFTSSALMKFGWLRVVALQEIHRIGTSRTTFLGNIYAKLCKRLKIYLASPEKSDPFHSFDKNAKQGRRKKMHRISIENVPRIEDMAELISRTSREGRIQHVRDRDFFSWRFQNPLCLYRFLYWGNDRLEGYLVLQAPKTSKKVGIVIVDFEATNMTVLSDLIATSIDWCEDDNLMTWAATLSRDEKLILQQHGFDAPEKPETSTDGAYFPSVMARPIHPDILETEWKLGNHRLLDITNWNLRPIFSDNF